MESSAEPRRLEEFLWELPIGYVDGMRVPARVFASQALFEKAVEDRAVNQIANVATLPGIVGAALAMPDIHWGYGFPIGGVAATDIEAGGAVSPGGVGFDIGCGVRLVRSDLTWEADVGPRIRDLVNELGQRVPRGVGGKGRMRLDAAEVDQVLREGVKFPLSKGVGWDEDAEFTEDAGTLPGARAEKVSERAKERGAPQLGSLGAGNHFLEVQVIDEIRDQTAADAMGLFLGQVCVMIHSGSRGIGHQTCTDHVKTIDRLMPELGIDVPDRQLASVPFDHPVAQDYFGAMDAAGNYAKANRHLLTDATRDAFRRVFRRPARDMGMRVVYDISHNLAKLEEYEVEGVTKKLCVHRKGATRAFGPGQPDLPDAYRAFGQPVIIPGSMGTNSFVLVGTNDARDRSFSSTCHGAGRAMSRTQAKKVMSGQELKRELEGRGITLAASQWKLLSEEAPYAYKDASEVVETCEGARLTKVVARLRPVGVVKG
ncbi:MAG TPA: RtcB family protein [Actinomycetota bacterium]|nr:RtcB family protein [Actinomycetota bacterium]